MDNTLDDLLTEIRACRVCEKALGFTPRPLVAARRSARVLIVGQAPSSRGQAVGMVWEDDSGDRLRDWLGLDRDVFHDADLIAHMPTGFCYPGRASGGDKPPRPECAPRWHDRMLAELPDLRLTLLIGRHAQRRYLPEHAKSTLADTVRHWRNMPPGLFPLPHPAWRSRLFMARNPWFEAEVLPDLRRRIAEALA